MNTANGFIEVATLRRGNGLEGNLSTEYIGEGQTSSEWQCLKSQAEQIKGA